MRCPICEKSFEPVDSTALPFCSARCRQIDLSRWLGEEYHVPDDRRSSDDEDDAESAEGA